MNKKQTLEQLRAQDAWNCVNSAQEDTAIDYEKYVNAAKSMPILIMNSGLMQMLAFANEKGNEQRRIADQLREWLTNRFDDLEEAEFRDFMRTLMKEVKSQDYQAMNGEALAWLKWMRQMAAAQKRG